MGRRVERGKTSGRVDDNKETITKSVTTYNEAILPANAAIVIHFQSRNKVKDNLDKLLSKLTIYVKHSTSVFRSGEC